MSFSKRPPRFPSAQTILVANERCGRCQGDPRPVGYLIRVREDVGGGRRKTVKLLLCRNCIEKALREQQAE